ncbi:hypothetical protein DYB26_001005 [Aphanomyces astaci]|uniref:Copine C-terminal domain-containing protein n=1 Tax=Aphanomyces astaci TaxID=112090 RepID=A0A3R7AJ28_APHAT|nr:hypothetical protein DYB26_001005 [Aphanomyces astaci]
MGNGSSSETKPRGSSAAAPARPSVQAQSSFQRIANNYSNLRDLKQVTKSNEWTGKRTFRGQCLHDVSSMRPNLYEEVMDIVGRTLCDFDDDNIIPVFGFGDQVTGDHSVFSFMPLQNSGQPTIPGYALQGVRPRYREIAPHVCMAGPTSFAPIILQAVNTVIANRYAYHILVIIADGQVTRSVDVPDGQFGKQELDTMNAICYASNFPLSIVLVGVGDGPWDTMAQFDDALPQRRFDNFQFVEFNQVHSDLMLATCKREAVEDAVAAVGALADPPHQRLAWLRFEY